MKEIIRGRGLITFLYLLAFILLYEWLILITVLTETGYLSVFLAFIGISFLLYLLNVKWMLSIPLKLLYILWAIQIIYFDKLTISLEALSFVVNSMVLDLRGVLTGEFGEISNISRTIGFFLFIWMLVYLIRYWIEVKQRIFLFYFTTIALVATADTFSVYSAENSIFILMIVGLLLLGLLMALRLTIRFSRPFSMRKVIRIMTPLVLLLVISGSLISFSPKLSPVWADPVPFLKSVVDESTAGSPTVSKSGYDPNDAQLGGPFIEDDSLVFEALVLNRQYWKVETKDTYTSKGWIQSAEDSSPTEIELGQKISSDMTLTTDLLTAQLSLTEEFPFIIYPYGVQSIDSPHDVTLYYDQLMDKYNTEKNGNPFPLSVYQMDFRENSFSLKQLRDTSMEELADSLDFEEYLQLPDSLPERVSTLAHSITESSDSVYEKAKDIEQYFSRDGFVYERTDVAIPTGEEDYVDQFLFDTKKGYCDNFSSSMVVMLRTLGIPARWVKGFAPGEQIRNAEGEQIYRVSNNEAHSWVEAYMPDVGWLPFEPTVGFDGVGNIDYDLESSMDDPEVEEVPKEEQDEFEKEEDEKEEVNQLTPEKKTFSLNRWFEDSIGWLMWGLGIGVGISVILYFTRKKWFPKLLLYRYRVKDSNWETFSTQYHQLLKRLNRIGIKRAANETLMTYASRVDRYYGVKSMQTLTEIYEKGLYGESDDTQDWQELQKIWEDLIKRTSD